MSPVSALKSFFSPGYPRNIWHLLLLITAFFAAVFAMVDLEHTTLPLVYHSTINELLLMLGLVGFALLAIFCLWKAAGRVRYWALFLWLGLFLLFATTASFLFSSSVRISPGVRGVMSYQLLYFLASILLFVFFWNLGRFDRRIGVPLLLFCGIFSGAVFYLTVDSFDVSLLIVPVCFTVFLILYCLSVFLALSARELPGFCWLFAGFLLFSLGLLGWAVDSYLDLGLFPLMVILILISPIPMIVGASLFTLKMNPAQLEKRLRKASTAKEEKEWINGFDLTLMSALESYFPTGSPRNFWYLLLLISALFVTAFTIVDLMLIFRRNFPIVLFLFFTLGFVVLALLPLFCIRKVSGIVGRWALFLWLGFFSLFAGLFIAPSSDSITYQLFYLLGNVLLLVFFWNLGNFNWRILALLFLIFTPLSVILFISEPGRNWGIAEVGFMVVFTVGFTIYSVFYSLFVIMAVNSNKLLRLPGFRWLFAGFSLFLVGCVVSALSDSYFENDEKLSSLMVILILISPILLTVGASLFTLKMDPLELEKRLRKAAPPKEVDSGV